MSALVKRTLRDAKARRVERLALEFAGLAVTGGSGGESVGSPASRVAAPASTDPEPFAVIQGALGSSPATRTG